MSWARWNYLKIGFLLLLQGALTAVLFYPWLQLAANFWGFAPQAAFLWAFLTAVITIYAFWQSSGWGRSGLIFLSLGFLLALVSGAFCGLPLYLAAPLILIFYSAASRFTEYFRRGNFAGDWVLASFLLVLTSLLQPYLNYDLSLGHTVFFFGGGIIALILWNTTRLERRGLRPNYRGLGRFIPLFILAVLLLAGALSLLLSPGVLQRGVAFVRSCYHGFAELLVLLIVKPFAWLMSPLFRWAEKMEGRELELTLPETESEPTEFFEIDESVLSQQALQGITWLSWALGFVVLCGGLWLIFRWARKKKRPQELAFGRETRESVYSRREVWEDLKRAFQKIIKPWRARPQAHRYRGGDPLKLIRAAYARFALQMGKKTAFPGENTPLEYYEELAAEKRELDLKAVAELTFLYNEARYGEKGDEESVNAAETALRRIF